MGTSALNLRNSQDVPMTGPGINHPAVQQTALLRGGRVLKPPGLLQLFT